MRGDRSEGPDILAIGRRLGGSAFNGVALLAIAAPLVVAWSWRSGVDDASGHELARASRAVVGADLVETRASEGFAEVADDVAKAARPPDWGTLRRRLEAQRRADLWYSVRVAWVLDDGGLEETTYVRHPYHDREHYREFLRIVRGDGPEASQPGATLQIPQAEDQGPIPVEIVDRLRATRPWAR